MSVAGVGYCKVKHAEVSEVFDFIIFVLVSSGTQQMRDESKAKVILKTGRFTT